MRHEGAMPEGVELLRTEEAARRLGVSARTLDSWRWLGTGPRYIKLTARVVRYPADALQEWVATHPRRSPSGAGPPPGGRLKDRFQR
jgi:predicted DNA-binding transcriptional regulator AlpA